MGVMVLTGGRVAHPSCIHHRLHASSLSLTISPGRASCPSRPGPTAPLLRQDTPSCPVTNTIRKSLPGPGGASPDPTPGSIGPQPRIRRRPGVRRRQRPGHRGATRALRVTVAPQPTPHRGKLLGQAAVHSRLARR